MLKENGIKVGNEKSRLNLSKIAPVIPKYLSILFCIRTTQFGRIWTYHDIVL